MTRKPVRHAEHMEVVYSKKHWSLLKTLQSRAVQVMEILDQSNLHSVVHGSIARGDINVKSDIDVFLPNPPSSFIIENVLQNHGVPVNRRVIIQATPLYAIKGYIEIDEKRCISFPLVKLRPVEKDFYKFGGEASLPQLKEEKRIPGVDKRLMFIEPTPNGHVESTIIGQGETIAKVLGVSLNTVLDRVHALQRRDKVGRTGVFVERELLPNETFEMVLKKLAYENPAVRRRLKFYGR